MADRTPSARAEVLRPSVQLHSEHKSNSFAMNASGYGSMTRPPQSCLKHLLLEHQLHKHAFIMQFTEVPPVNFKAIKKKVIFPFAKLSKKEKRHASKRVFAARCCAETRITLQQHKRN